MQVWTYTETWDFGQGEPQVTAILAAPSGRPKADFLLFPFLVRQVASILSFKNNYAASKPYGWTKFTFINYSNYSSQLLLPTPMNWDFFLSPPTQAPKDSTRSHCQFLENYKELTILRNTETRRLSGCFMREAMNGALGKRKNLKRKENWRFYL